MHAFLDLFVCDVRSSRRQLCCVAHRKQDRHTVYSIHMPNFVSRLRCNAPHAASQSGASSSSLSHAVVSDSSSHDSADQHDGDNSDGPNGCEQDSDSESQEAQDLRLKRRAQTEKARAAAFVAKAKRKMAKTMPPPEHPAAEFKDALQPRPTINRPGGFLSNKLARWRRLRVVISFFQCWCARLESFLTGTVPCANHLFTVSVIDDTNMVLSDLVDKNLRKARVVTLMNMVETCVICFDDPSTNCESHGTFLVHVPPVALPQATAGTIWSEVKSYLLVWMSRVSDRFKAFGLSESIFNCVPIQATVLVWDSLATNVSILRGVREIVHLHHETEGSSTLHPAFAIFCNLHQLALARKPLIHHFHGCWSSVVRLSHLFETSSFRSHFRSALINVICSSFRVIVVSSPPAESRQWRHQRNKICNLATLDTTYSVRRRKLHWELSQFDNGDPLALDFTHFCNGGCCQGSTPEEKGHFALIQTCRLYVLLFAQGYPVPLLYWWVHGHKALQFCNVT